MPATRLAKINLKRSPVSFGALHTVSIYCVKGHRRDGAVMMLISFPQSSSGVQTTFSCAFHRIPELFRL